VLDYETDLDASAVRTQPWTIAVRSSPWSAWAASNGRLSAVEEIQIGAIRRDGAPRQPRPIWIVGAPDHIYAHVAYGHRGSAHRVAAATAATRGTPADASALELVDALYREKYDSHYPRTLIRP